MSFATYPSLKDKVVFITGGGGGIGATLVEEYHAQGAKVAFVSHDDASDLSGRLGVWFEGGDVTDVSWFEAAIARASGALGAIDVLINNVANDSRHLAVETDLESWRKGLAVNLDAAFLAARAVYPGMKGKGRGAIVNISSINALLGPSEMVTYVAAKGAINAMTKALAREWGPDGVRVNTLSPGWIITERQLKLWLTPEAEEEWMKLVAIKDRIWPTDVAQLAMFLTADDSAKITGQNFVIDGGADVSFLACDWGTTNLRAWVLDEDGKVIRSRDFPLGVAKLAPGEAARRFRDEVRPGLVAENLPAILCGMIGSTLGWAVADYLPCPVGLSDLDEGLLEVDRGVRIVPGLKTRGRFGASDVMRGEETQILGWLHADPSRLKGRRVVCHPGTHAKWAICEDGRIVDFLTSMTGELFGVMSKHSVLKSGANPGDPDGFEAGLRAAGDGLGLASRLFSARARIVADGQDPESAAAYLSGLIIGSDVAAAPKILGVEGEPVAVLGEVHLCRQYGRALEAAGIQHTQHEGDAAAIAGLFALHREAMHDAR